MKKEALKTVLKFVIFFSIGLGFIWLFQRHLSLEEKREIGKAFESVNYWMLVGVLVAGLMSHLLRTWRWQILIEPIDRKPGTLNTFLSVMVGYFANLAVPRLGEVVRCTMLYRYEKIPVQKTFGTVITERILDVLLFGLVFVTAFVWEYSSLKEYVNKTVFDGLLNKAETLKFLGYAALFTAGLLLVLYLLYKKYKTRIQEQKIYQKIGGVLGGFAQGIMSLSKIRKPGLFVLYSVLMWFCYWLMLHFAFLSLPELQQVAPSLSLTALAMGTIGIMLTPGGIGLYPVIISETLAVFGIAKSIGYAAGWIAWGSQTLMIIVAGLVSLVLLPLLNRNFQKQSTPQEINKRDK